jgi:ABC-type sugar transport system permease subunit
VACGHRLIFGCVHNTGSSTVAALLARPTPARSRSTVRVLGTANLPYAIYQTFYTAHDYGRASAAGVVVVIGTIIIATFALRTVSSLFRQETSR